MAVASFNALSARTRDCVVCGRGFTFEKIGRGRDRRFCSQDCKAARLEQQRVEGSQRRARGEYRNKRHAERALCPISIFTCVECGRLAARGLNPRGNRFCSLGCHASWNARDRSSDWIADLRLCKACDASFYPCQPNQSHCSNSCRHQVWNSLKNAKRKTRTLEYLNPYAVFARDNWRCQICGRKTPRSLRGTKNARAPELDHIIPLSKGGGHTYDNTQCACKRCNSIKSNRTIEGQIPLFAHQDLVAGGGRPKKFHRPVTPDPRGSQ